MTPKRAAMISRRTVIVAPLVVAAALIAALQLGPSSPESQLVRAGSGVGAATAAQERTFGGEPIVISLRGEMNDILAPQNLTSLLGLEQGIGRIAGVHTVFGPASFVDQAVRQMNRVVVAELGPAAERADVAANRAMGRAKAGGAGRAQRELIGRQARLRALGPLRRQYEALFVRFGYIGLPSLTNRNFVAQLVLGAGRTPKQRFAWLFPDGRHALVVVRLKAGLGDSRVRAIERELQGLLARTRLGGLRAEVAGAPLVIAQATPAVARELLRLLPAVLAAMVLVLLVGLRRRGRGLPLLVPAGAAVILTAGLSWPAGLGFTAATLAALPVVLGLSLDYSLQLQARYWIERAAGRNPADAATRALRRIGPTLLLAGGVMAAGFLALLASPVPLVGDLGITLVIGVASCLGCAFALTVPLLVALDRPGVEPLRLSLPDRRPSPLLRWAGLGVACAMAVAGLALSAHTPVESDLRKLAAPSMPEMRNLEALQRQLGTSGQLRVAITARDVTSPAVLGWTARVERRLLATSPGLRAGPNLAAILSGGGAGLPDAAGVQRLLGLVPREFVSAVLSPDHRRAELSFGVPLGSAGDQARTIERMRQVLDTAPPGVHAAPAGLLAESAAAVTGLQGERPWLLLLAAFVIFALLYAVRRRVDLALVPLLPALVVAGLTALFVELAGLRLSPLSAGLDPLVLAVGVEFGLLLQGRYREERAAGRSPAAAARAATQAVGPPVAVSGAAVALAFGVLAVSRLAVLRQFGTVAAVELVLCVVAAIAMVPPLCAAFDRRRARTVVPARRRVSLTREEPVGS